MVIAEDRSDHKLREANPDWNWDYWDAQVEIKCVICHKLDPFCIKTNNGAACRICIDQLVSDVIKMRTPWAKEYQEVRANRKEH
jgi:hypothetical protein|tara:strand:+ start:627 stop:878 length:252 start_codon:yes stop_codon:yes gene_type:complete